MNTNNESKQTNIETTELPPVLYVKQWHNFFQEDSKNPMINPSFLKKPMAKNSMTIAGFSGSPYD